VKQIEITIVSSRETQPLFGQVENSLKDYPFISKVVC